MATPKLISPRQSRRRNRQTRTTLRRWRDRALHIDPKRSPRDTLRSRPLRVRRGFASSREVTILWRGDPNLDMDAWRAQRKSRDEQARNDALNGPPGTSAPGQ
jgi:hypothetical protein